jgi:hypothetical protein
VALASRIILQATPRQIADDDGLLVVFAIVFEQPVDQFFDVPASLDCVEHARPCDPPAGSVGTADAASRRNRGKFVKCKRQRRPTTSPLSAARRRRARDPIAALVTRLRCSVPL